MKHNFTPAQIAQMSPDEAGRHITSAATALANSSGAYADNYYRAFHDAQVLNPELAARMRSGQPRTPAGSVLVIGNAAALPVGAAVSGQDGQDLTTGWPVSVDVLKKMGLPVDATAAEFNTYLRAAKVKITPDIAAVVVKTTIQAMQLQHAVTFKDAMTLLKQRFPEIHTAALEAGKAQ